MPLQQIVPTWTAWNNANFTSPTALTDLRTGQPFAAGGLNLGDYFDATEQEANQASYTTNGLLHSGRYRYVQLASNAVTGNAKVGYIGYMAQGASVQSVQVATQGTGQTLGTYIVTAAGGGSPTAQATIQVIVTSATTIQVTLLTPGSGYTAVPTFTLATGGTPGTVVADMLYTPNIVTDYSTAAGVGLRPVVFLNTITPGNYGFVQELGMATVLGKASSFTGSAAVGAAIAGNSGLADVQTGTPAVTTATVGTAIDLPVISTLFRIFITGPVVQD
jgi:hypothetical protein